MRLVRPRAELIPGRSWLFSALVYVSGDGKMKWNVFGWRKIHAELGRHFWRQKMKRTVELEEKIQTVFNAFLFLTRWDALHDEIFLFDVFKKSSWKFEMFQQPRASSFKRNF